MEGSLEKLLAVQGEGVFGIARFAGRELLGSSPGARKRVKAWLALPPASARVKRAFLLMGFEVSSNARFPLRAKVSLDDAGVSRELRPQFIVNLDETKYIKMVYDVTPTHAGKLASRDFHKLLVIYDAIAPLYLRDAMLLVFYEVENVRYSISVVTGAKVLEPGEVTVEYPEFFEHMGGEREASLLIHSPYHGAEFEIVVAGSDPVRVGGMGSLVAEVSFQYKGSLVPVSIRYIDPGYTFYPRRAVVTDLCVCETDFGGAKLSLELEDVRVSRRGNTVVVEGKIVNNSNFECKRITISLMGGGSRLAFTRIERLPPGGTASFRLEGRLVVLPVVPSKIFLNVNGFILSRKVGLTRSFEI